MVDPVGLAVPHGAAPPPRVDTWHVDSAAVDALDVDVDAFIVKLRVAPDNRYLLHTPGVMLAGSWTPGRDANAMKGKVQLTASPALMYTHQVRQACWGPCAGVCGVRA